MKSFGWKIARALQEKVVRVRAGREKELMEMTNVEATGKCMREYD
jgi:hypothetical protein